MKLLESAAREVAVENESSVIIRTYVHTLISFNILHFLQLEPSVHLPLHTYAYQRIESVLLNFPCCFKCSRLLHMWKDNNRLSLLIFAHNWVVMWMAE